MVKEDWLQRFKPHLGAMCKLMYETLIFWLDFVAIAGEETGVKSDETDESCISNERQYPEISLAVCSRFS
jgi:hypothetical protein